MKTPTIYLAGKINEDKWKFVEPLEPMAQFIDTTKSWVAINHCTRVRELFFACNGMTREAWMEGEDPWEIPETFIQQIEGCDGLLAYLNTPDSYGSVAEIAYASALGKPVLVLIEEPEGTDLAEKLADAYWFASMMPGVQFAHALAGQVFLNNRSEGGGKRLLGHAATWVYEIAAAQGRSVVGALRSEDAA